MELLLIIRVLLRWWYLILIPTVIVALFTVPDLIGNTPATSGGFSTMIRYTASQELDAIPNRDGDFQDVWRASELTVDAFTEWIQASRFRQEVATVTAEQGLEINPDALGIAADNEGAIGQIFLSWSDAAEMQIIIDAVIEVLQNRNQDYFPQLGGEPAHVIIMDDPVISPNAPSLPNRFRPLIQLALGVIAGVGLAFLVEYLDPTLRQKEDLTQIGLPIVASIPKDSRR